MTLTPLNPLNCDALCEMLTGSVMQLSQLSAQWWGHPVQSLMGSPQIISHENMTDLDQVINKGLSIATGCIRIFLRKCQVAVSSQRGFGSKLIFEGT